MPRRYEADGSKLTRWTYLLLGAVASVLAILSIFQLVIAFEDYRMVDFEAATANTNMKNLKGTTLPTCIEGITEKTVKARENDWDRRTDDYNKDCLENDNDQWEKGLALAVQNTAHLFLSRCAMPGLQMTAFASSACRFTCWDPRSSLIADFRTDISSFVRFIMLLF